jgi:hypothetical protein
MLNKFDDIFSVTLQCGMSTFVTEFIFFGFPSSNLLEENGFGEHNFGRDELVQDFDEGLLPPGGNTTGELSEKNIIKIYSI